MGDQEIPYTDPDDPGFDPEALPAGPRPTSEATQPGLFGTAPEEEEDDQPTPPADIVPGSLAALAYDIDGPSIYALTEMFYGPTGPIAQAGWEVRDSQRVMSLEVARRADAGLEAFRTGDQPGQREWSIVEAPCGVGKGLAYLVPGLLASVRAEALRPLQPTLPNGRKPPAPKLIVSTAGIALQAQLIRKDIPNLGAMLGFVVRSAMMKSVSNYLCKKNMMALGGEVANRDVASLVHWSMDENCTGDKEDLAFEVSPAAWAQVSTTSDSCAGPKCSLFKQCHWALAKRGADIAHVVVANHHYLALASMGPAHTLAVDEAHKFEEALRKAAELRIGPGVARFWMKSTHLDQLLDEPGVGQSIADAVIRLLTTSARAARMDERTRDAKVIPDISDAMQADVRRFHILNARVNVAARGAGLLAKLNGRFYAPKSGGQEMDRIARGVNAYLNLSEKFAALANHVGDESFGEIWAWFCEPAPFDPKRRDYELPDVVGAPADVAAKCLALGDNYPQAVITSATLPDFDGLRPMLGFTTSAPPKAELRLPSPYPLHELGALAVPLMPDPKDPEWPSAAVERVVDLVAASGGGALVLATSNVQKKAYARALRERLPNLTVREQGDAGRTELLRWFASDVDGVLVGSRSFFEGVDVQGQACRLVIIDKIPFGGVGDPVEEAVGAWIVEQMGGKDSAYMLRTVPQAAMALAQGAGRLIRCATDRGVVALLDTRILNNGGAWGKLRAALPPFPVVRTAAAVRRALAGSLLPEDVTTLDQSTPAGRLATPTTGMAIRRRPVKPS
jgi:ATP-dependent DNA helicase DinG